MSKVNVLDGIFEKFENDDRYIKAMLEVDNAKDVEIARERFVKCSEDEPIFNEACSAFIEGGFKQGFRCAMQLFSEVSG